MPIVLSRIHGSKRVSDSDTEGTGVCCFSSFRINLRREFGAKSKGGVQPHNQVSSPTIALESAKIGAAYVKPHGVSQSYGIGARTPKAEGKGKGKTVHD